MLALVVVIGVVIPLTILFWLFNVILGAFYTGSGKCTCKFRIYVLTKLKATCMENPQLSLTDSFRKYMYVHTKEAILTVSGIVMGLRLMGI